MKIFCLVLWLLMCLPLFAAAGQPDQCLNSISAAIDAGDSATFERLVDVDAILSQALDVFLSEASRQENARQLPPMLTLMLSQAASQPDLRNLLLREARSFIIDGVASGAFAGKKLPGATQQGLLAPLFAHASIGRKEVRGVGKPVDDGENGWRLPFSVHDYGNGNDYAVIGHFTAVYNGARLTGIENLEQLFSQILREAMPGGE